MVGRIIVVLEFLSLHRREALFVVFFVAIPVFRCLKYYREVLFLRRLEKDYMDFLQAGLKFRGPSEPVFKWLKHDDPLAFSYRSISQRKARLKKLVEGTPFEKNSLVAIERIQYRDFQVTKPVADAINDSDVSNAPYVQKFLFELEGFFTDRAKESFDPFYWLPFLQKLPKDIFGRLLQRLSELK